MIRNDLQFKDINEKYACVQSKTINGLRMDMWQHKVYKTDVPCIVIIDFKYYVFSYDNLFTTYDCLDDLYKFDLF